MAERLNDEILVELYGDYLRKHLGAGDPLGQLKWLQTPEAQEIGRMQATGLRMDRMSPADYKRAQELMGVHYGFMTNIPDQKRIMGKILQNLRNVPTLTIGCGLAPQEIFMSSQGILTSEVHATDLTNSAIKRAGEKARELNVNNITFESISGSEIDRPTSADQVMMIDSLHWMKDWRMAVGKATQALRPGGNMMIVYSPNSPRIGITPDSLALELRSDEMNITGIENISSSALTPRIFMTAEKHSAPIQLPAASM